MREWEDLRQVSADVVRGLGGDTAFLVRRVTRVAACRADDLLGAVADGRADSIGEVLTDGTGTLYFQYGVSGYGGSSGYGA